MFKFLIALLLVTPAAASAQTGFNAKEIPASKYQGKIKEGKKWKDKDGEHVVVLTAASAKLYAYHFIKTDTGYRQIWRVYDHIDDCELDIVCEHVKGSLSVTDLDKDGTSEISFVYLLSCRGDVSPDTKKLILYEGETKYAIRGTNMLSFPNAPSTGGEKQIDKNLKSAPASILAHANSQFDKWGNVKY
ncbi:MAG: hypothetical protein H7Y27_07040 [Gemmatimonadaceae bacterium]|nr:hypothetical protein [Chitinophagaceae bacterium]